VCEQKVRVVDKKGDWEVNKIKVYTNDVIENWKSKG